MRTMECPCGITLTGIDDDEMFRLGRAHADEHHPDDFIPRTGADEARDAAEA
ncbi:hypothetical protein MDOR_37630 [Mycolicibacterium doricum]|uniref:DUF1059 domain-containing protein n=1 Tax=Mycolicibacterium doricum TaxID=126673 RepID=A0A7I7VWB7_9MYCO|nr:hypothetical protein [Mycolicibacterium doricum]MCV7267687.1 hypothetical protein [Mycolicibacterium doricum]BBZ09594.1 hypothetical protein MDOR_37630 [Mycolicibacterium doricum]